MNHNEIARAIETEIDVRFPECNPHFRFNADMSWDLDLDEQEYYYLYPGLTRDEADRKIVEDIHAIIAKHFPFPNLAWYEQHGKRIPYRGKK